MEKQTIRKFLNKAALFVKDIGLLTYKVTRQVNLPNRRRKGNVLSSMLLLFVSLTDLLVNFSWGFSINFITRWKHYGYCRSLIRKSVLITGFCLFFLSSFEWSYNAPSELNGTASIARIEDQLFKGVPELIIVFCKISFINSRTKRSELFYSKNIFSPFKAHPHPLKIYLKNCNFRI